MRDVFLIFLRLGLTSFGGPIAHLGYFRAEFVERRRWLDEALFAQIVAFCSILPGPTSSQVGLVIGLRRAGPGGALGAWLGFTLPSALALAIGAAALTSLEGTASGGAIGPLTGLLAGLGAAATGIVAQAVVAMAKTQCPDPTTQTIAAAAAVVALVLAPFAGLQWMPIALGALAGALLLRDGRLGREAVPVTELPVALPRSVSVAAAGLFVLLVTVAAFAARASSAGAFLATFVRAGSLVFGGGHVVLPLLQSLTGAGFVPARDFVAGYGATQAMPGPLFAFAAFLGQDNSSPIHGAAGALAATTLIFLPSFLLVFAFLPVLGALRANPGAAGALRGANAAVVGLLGALLYSPLISALGHSPGRIAIALGVFTLVTAWRIAPWIAVASAGIAGMFVARAT